MKKVLLFILPPVLACILFFIFTFVMSHAQVSKGALQVTSNPQSNVYVDGKFIGRSPFCKCELTSMLFTGEHTIKLVPDDTNTYTPFEQKITITKSVITVVDYAFGVNNTSSGSIITLNVLPQTKTAELFVTSFPTQAKVYVDKNLSGLTPLLIKSIPESDHDISFLKDGYQNKVVRIHTVNGYQLSTIAFLGIASLDATQSASPTPPPLAAASVAPTISPTSAQGSLTILQTPTGFLRVRADASIDASETARVNPGDVFPVMDVKSGWYEIQLKDGSIGWVSSQYVKTIK